MFANGACAAFVPALLAVGRRCPGTGGEQRDCKAARSDDEFRQELEDLEQLLEA